MGNHRANFIYFNEFAWAYAEDTMVQILYFEDDNIFTDDDGHIIENIFELITPGDLYLFRSDPGYNVFPLRSNNRVLVEIVGPDEFPGDGYYNKKEELNEQEYFDCFNDSLCFGGRCRFSSSDQKARKEICRSCSGRN